MLCFIKSVSAYLVRVRFPVLVSYYVYFVRICGVILGCGRIFKITVSYCIVLQKILFNCFAFDVVLFPKLKGKTLTHI